MKRFYADLKPVFNRRYVFPAGTETDKMRPYFVEENFRFGVIEKDGAAVLIERNEAKMDNAVCDGQTVGTPDVPCGRAVIAGISSWGFYKENFTLKFSDGSVDYARAKFYDWCWPAKFIIESSLGLETEECTDYNHILASYPKPYDEKSGPDYYIYYYVTELGIKGRKLRQIIFPDNMFMNIFAITLEADE